MIKVAAVFALAATASAQLICNPATDCQYRAVVQGVVHKWDFSSLCQVGQDYTFDDGLGHTYYANICGRANKKCLPKGWTETYEYGVAVQTWGSIPSCNMSDPNGYCLDHDGQIPTCCTEDCQILGVGAPNLKLNNPQIPTSGVNATFEGAPPDDDDPFWCPWNPNTGSQYPRTVTFSLQCDMSVVNPPAIPILAVQNKTEDCDYLLVFASRLACPDTSALPRRRPSSGLGGGAVFAIIFFVGAFIYVVAGMLWTYRQEQKFYCPNRFFWSRVGDYVGSGYRYLVFCGKPNEDTGGASQGFVSTNPYSTGAPSSKGGFSGGYNASAGPAAPTAYTDL